MEGTAYLYTLASNQSRQYRKCSKAFEDLIAREIPRWAQVVKAGNVRAD
jgi:hypothetical protein